MHRPNSKPGVYSRLLLLTGCLFGVGLAAIGQQIPADSVRHSEVSRTDSTQKIVPRVTFVRARGEAWMRQQISFVSEFIKRFNGQQGTEGQPLDSAGRAQQGRNLMLKQLFNSEDPRLKARQKTYDPLYNQAAGLLIEDVVIDTANAYLGPTSELLYARVDCEVIYKSVAKTLALYLKQIKTRRYINWKVIGADISFMKAVSDTNFVRQVPDSLRFSLAPNTHETNFLALVEPLTTGENLLALTPASMPPDPMLTTLAKNLLAGTIKFIQPLKTTIYIDTGHDWVLQLGRFVRETDNSGWLITDLYGPTIGKQLPTPLQSFLSPSTSWSPKR